MPPKTVSGNELTLTFQTPKTLFDDPATITVRDVINTILMDGESYRPTKIIRSGDCTIVFWCDGRKTIVRKSADVSDDSLYTAFTAALAIRMYGSNSRLKKIIKEAYVEQKPRKEKRHGSESGKSN